MSRFPMHDLTFGPKKPKQSKTWFNACPKLFYRILGCHNTFTSKIFKWQNHQRCSLHPKCVWIQLHSVWIYSLSCSTLIWSTHLSIKLQSKLHHFISIIFNILSWLLCHTVCHYNEGISWTWSKNMNSADVHDMYSMLNISSCITEKN